MHTRYVGGGSKRQRDYSRRVNGDEYGRVPTRSGRTTYGSQPSSFQEGNRTSRPRNDRSQNYKLPPNLFALSRIYLTILRCLGHIRVLEDGLPRSLEMKSRELVDFITPAFGSDDFREDIVVVTEMWASSVLSSLRAHYRATVDAQLQRLRQCYFSDAEIVRVFRVTVTWFRDRRKFNRAFFDYALDVILSFHPVDDADIEHRQQSDLLPLVFSGRPQSTQASVHFSTPPRRSGRAGALDRQSVSIQTSPPPRSSVNSASRSFVKPNRVGPGGDSLRPATTQVPSSHPPTSASDTVPVSEPTLHVRPLIGNTINNNDVTTISMDTTTNDTDAGGVHNTNDHNSQTVSSVINRNFRKRQRSLDSSNTEATTSLGDRSRGTDILATPRASSDRICTHRDTRNKYKEWRLTSEAQDPDNQHTIRDSIQSLLIGDEFLSGACVENDSVSVHVFPGCTFEHLGAILYDCPVFPNVKTLLISSGFHCKRQDFTRTCLRSLKRVVGLVQRKFPNLIKFSVPCVFINDSLRQLERENLQTLNNFLLRELDCGGFVRIPPFTEVEDFIASSSDEPLERKLFRHWNEVFKFDFL